jgi:predicted metal-dependent peptidase
MPKSKYNEAKLTPLQVRQLEIARVAFMQEAPFYAHLMYSIGEEVITRDVPTAATDGKRIMLNPDYVCPLPVGKQVFVYAHEMSHLVCRHAQRFKYYLKQGNIKGKPVILEWANVCADYVINADIINSMPNVQVDPGWLYDPNIAGTELWEDVYERTLKVIPPPPKGKGKGKGQPGGGGGQPGDPQDPQDDAQGPPQLPATKQYKDTGKSLKGAKEDPQAANNPQPGRFDEVLEPEIDAEGQEDLPDENEFLEAVARAAAVAKAQGKLPAGAQRLVDELLTPQVDWRDHIRLLMTGKIGARGETWKRPNRRRLVLNPIVVLPGRKGYGCELVVVGVDTSGSIGKHELTIFLSEVGGILNDVKPRKILVIGCDANISQVDELTTLDEFEGLREKGIKGGGGTDFRPVFDYIKEHDLKPETMVYLTDLYGDFPSEAPTYPVVWAATSDDPVPFGDVVRIKN